MSMSNLAKKKICKLKGIEFQEQMMVNIDICSCGKGQVMMWSSHDKARCNKCGREWHVKELAEIVQDNYLEDHKETQDLMESYK